MFKELKVIKLIVFVGLLVAIISKVDSSKNVINELYTDDVSYYSDKLIKIYTSTNSFFSISRTVLITDISGKEISTVKINLKKEIDNLNALQEGLGYKNYIEYKFKKDIKSGIYLIEDKYPIIIKSKQKAEITVVYPFANNVLYYSYHDQNSNGQNVFSLNIKHASLGRTAELDKYSKGLNSFFDYLNDNYNVNYISDLDLEDFNNYKDSKALIMYGKLSCWTPDMKESFNNYITHGGNVLLMTTNMLNNICWYNKNDKNVTMYSDSVSAMQSWYGYNGTSLDKLIGVAYSNGGYSKTSTYKLAYENHPLLKDLESETITLQANLYSSPPVKWYDDLPRVDLDSMGFYKAEIIAYGDASYQENQKGIKGIFVLQADTNSGKIVSLGTEDWCLKENYEKNKSIQIVTKNAVKYLLE